MPGVSQLVKDRASMQTQAACPERLLNSCYAHSHHHCSSKGPWHAYYMLGTVLSAFHVSTHFVHQQLNDASTVYPSFTHEENEDQSASS